MTLDLARLALARLVLAGAVAASALSVAACSENALASRDRTAVQNMTRAEAYREASRRCNGADMRVASGSDGTNPSDYICAGH